MSANRPARYVVVVLASGVTAACSNSPMTAGGLAQYAPANAFMPAGFSETTISSDRVQESYPPEEMQAIASEVQSRCAS